MKARLFGISLVALLAACSTQHAGLQIKPVGDEGTRPDDGSLVKAQILLSRGEYALAIDAYRKAVRHDPANAAAYNGLAISYDGVGRFDLSRRYYELALAHAPRVGKYYRNLALSLKRQGKADEAAQVLAQIEAAPFVRTTVASPAPKAAPRTLATIARDGLTSVAEAVSSAIRPHLERLSMGEVLLATGGADKPVRAARSITVPIPVVEQRQPAQDIPLVAQLTARPVGSSITIELPEVAPIKPEEPVVELASEAFEHASDAPLAELQTARSEMLHVESVQIALAAEPSALLAMTLRPAAEPERSCDAPAPAPVFETAAIGNASLAVFLGDFAPARLGRGAIDLPLIYRASVNLPAPVRETATVSSCTVQMADSPADARTLFTLWWRDMDGLA